ncbi:MAG: transcriptional repressor [Gemmatimonadetes bacterium]|nr:transcriptional repressor [Gemmatimonadota bacterium]
MPFVHLFERYLREQGLPVTQQRAAVADAVFSAVGHLSVDDIEQRLRDSGERIGKATIYRTLDLLVKSGLVDEHDFGEGFKRYEHLLHRQPVHQHLICLECGKVTEFRSDALQAIQNDVATAYAFTPTRHRFEIYGLCADCRDAGVTIRYQGLTCPIEKL